MDSVSQLIIRLLHLFVQTYFTKKENVMYLHIYLNYKHTTHRGQKQRIFNSMKE